MAAHKTEEEKKLYCSYCDKHFDTVRLLRRHMYRYHKLYTCNICEVKLLKGAYEYHKRSVHKIRPDCTVCGKMFATRRSLLTHNKKIHFGERNCKWKCPVCPYLAPDGYQFEVHKARHSKAPSLVCEHCGARSYTNTELRKHIQIDHFGGYTCNLCGKSFRCPEYLKKHRLSHNGDTSLNKMNFTCRECGKGFIKQVNLKRHLLKHKGALPTFRCDLCGKQLSSKQSFAAHLGTHSRSKPYVCMMCNRAFSEKRYLQWHLRQHNVLPP